MEREKIVETAQELAVNIRNAEAGKISRFVGWKSCGLGRSIL